MNRNTVSNGVLGATIIMCLVTMLSLPACAESSPDLSVKDAEPGLVRLPYEDDRVEKPLRGSLPISSKQRMAIHISFRITEAQNGFMLRLLQSGGTYYWVFEYGEGADEETRKAAYLRLQQEAIKQQFTIPDREE